MEPRIQYAKTADGVNIAFWTLGEGMPLVHMPNPPWRHIQLPHSPDGLPLLGEGSRSLLRIL
jgi:hypothetical protein